MSGTKKKPSKKTICIIVAIVLLLGIIGSCNDSLKDKNKEPETTISNTTVVTTTSKPTTATTVTTTTEATTEPTTEEETEPKREIVHTQASYDYIVNTNTGKFHYGSCSQAGRIKEENKAVIHGTSDELESMGYTPCGKCNP